jgi:arylsulfatase A-like enzyme
MLPAQLTHSSSEIAISAKHLENRIAAVRTGPVMHLRYADHIQISTTVPGQFIRGRHAVTHALGLLLLMAWVNAPLHASDKRPNVLFIAIDDLNDWIGCLGGHPQVKTPNMDRLAKRGTLFTNAHCQSPLCNPSRSSLLTGLRPSTTGIYGLKPGIREVDALKNHVTLPQTFTSAGYFTFTCGKIYHDSSLKLADQPREFNTWGPAPGLPKSPKRFVPLPNPHPAMDWGPFPKNDEDQADWKIASAAIEAIKNAPRDKPFFISVGFRLPHVPCYASQKWFDFYPDDKLVMPPVNDGDRDDTPMFSWYLHWKLPEPRLSQLRKIGHWRSLVRAYLASTSFVDSQVGRVLQALEEAGLADDTIIVLWSDHGYHLGEKGITGKNTLWERSTRVPLMFAGPGIAKNAKCSRPAELLDIFPTLLELGRFPARKDLEGLSLVPQLRDAKAARDRPAITTHNQGNHAIRTEQWRYIRYADGSEELYDIHKDPREWTNLAANVKLAETKRELARWLPNIDVPPVPGSAHRIITYDKQTGVVTWEGKTVDPKELEK